MAARDGRERGWRWRSVRAREREEDDTRHEQNKRALMTHK
jgi:hypothetical protein